MVKRKAKGDKIDDKNIRKHKGDIFRLGIMFAEDDVFELSDALKNDMQEFANAIGGDLPDKQIFKTMGLGNVNVENVYAQLKKSFGL